MNTKLCKHFFKLIPVLIFYISACKKNQTVIEINNFSQQYSVSETKIYRYNEPLQAIGVNAFHLFGAGGSDMNKWNIDITREFVGNVKEVVLTGSVIVDANGSYLHPMQSIADSNRKNNRITVFCAFGWDGTSATEFTGKRPSKTIWWNEYKLKLKQWATHFKDQKDVWMEVWNEPYRYDRTDGYTDEIWLSDMNELVGIIRNTGNENIILVPCAEQGQDESVLINKGTIFLAGKQNILFDIHAYEKWLLVPDSDVANRLQNLTNHKLPVIFGEVAPLNAGVLMNPKPFLESIYNRGLSVCSWIWKYDSNDKDAILDNNGLPNNNNNNNWGSLYTNLCSRPRKP